MRVIVAGTLSFAPGSEAGVIERARAHIEATFGEPGCIHYAWTVDPLNPGTVWVYEEWESPETLTAHLAGPAYLAMRDHLATSGLRDASVAKYRVDLKEPVYDPDGNPRGDFFTQG